MSADSVFPLLVAVSVACAVLGASLLVLSWLSAREKLRVRQRVLQIIHPNWGGTTQPTSGMKGMFSQVGLRLEKSGMIVLDAEVPPLLARAGWGGREAQIVFFGIQVLLPLAVTAGVAFFYLPWFWRAPDMWTVLVLFAVFAAAYLAPKRILHVRAAARQKRIAEEVPVFADLLRILFDVGLGMDQALVMIASENRETIPELSAELTAVIRQVAAGADRSDALSDMAAAIDVHDLTEVVALLRQIDRYGGAVQEPLLEFAGLLQDKRRTELQEKVGKLSGRMTVVMVLFLFPALLAIVGGPGFLAVIRALSRQ